MFSSGLKSTQHTALTGKPPRLEGSSRAIVPHCVDRKKSSSQLKASLLRSPSPSVAPLLRPGLRRDSNLARTALQAAPASAEVVDNNKMLRVRFYRRARSYQVCKTSRV